MRIYVGERSEMPEEPCRLCRAASPLGRHDGEVPAVAQAVGPEVIVQGEDRSELSRFGDGDEAGVSEIHRMIPVALHELGTALRKWLIEFGDRQGVAFDQPPERFLGGPAGGLAEQVDGFGEGWPGAEQWKLELLERRCAEIVIRFAGIDESDQRTRVGQRHDLLRRKSSSSPNAAPDRLASPPSVRTAPITSSS